MKAALAGLLALSLAALTGCDEGRPGGPGASTPTTKPPVSGEPDNSFKLNMPIMSTTLRQGETKELAIGIDRGKGFDEDVTLEFADTPKGVTLASLQPILKHGDSESKVKIQAAEDAALGDFTVKVIGHPAKGPNATSDLKLTVVKK
jgi:hypothetical protein